MTEELFESFVSVLNQRAESLDEVDPVIAGMEPLALDPGPGLGNADPDRDSVEDRESDLEQCEICSRKSCRCKKGDAPAHAGRRRRRITEDLFRCKLPLVIKGQKIPCNALVWRRPDKMREHLCDHLTKEEIEALNDTQLQIHYANAARIAQEGIYDDEIESEDDD